MPSVLTEVDGNVGVIYLNRPDRMNGWNRALEIELYDALDKHGADDQVRVIVLTGKGRAFCAGADMALLKSVSGSNSTTSTVNVASDSRTPLHPKLIPKPVICAINGPVAGVGLSLALNCDMRFANRDAKFTAAFSKLGLVAEYGMSWTMPHITGTGNAMWLAMTSEVVRGDEALRLGIVQKVYDGDVIKQSIAFAQHMADTVSPTSMAVMKQQLWTHPLLSHEQAAEQSIELMVSSLSDENTDFVSGVKGFLTKSKPSFAPLNMKNPVLQKAAQFKSKL